MKTITAQELKESEEITIIDVLSPESYEQHHIPRAINIPVDDIDSVDLPKDEKIVVYCASKACQASPAAARKLEEMGYTDVTDFEEGLEGWQQAGYDFES